MAILYFINGIVAAETIEEGNRETIRGRKLLAEIRYDNSTFSKHSQNTCTSDQAPNPKFWNPDFFFTKIH